MADNGDDFGSFFMGFIIGGLVGAATALLLAPQSGEETRTVIKEKSIELKDKAVEVGQESRVKAEKALEEARAKADKAIEELQVRANEFSQMTKSKATELQQRGQVVIEEQKARIESAIGGVKKTDQKPDAPAEEAGPAEA